MANGITTASEPMRPTTTATIVATAASHTSMCVDWRTVAPTEDITVSSPRRCLIDAIRLLTQLWDRVIESIRANEELWFVNFESVAFAQHDPEIRQMNADGQSASRDALSLAFAGLGSESDPATRRAIGSHYYSLLIGLALQILTDEDNAPTARQIFETDDRGTSSRGIAQ